MLSIIPEFSPFVRYKQQILDRQLYNVDGNSEVLAMLEYGDGYTNKSIAYLFDGDYVVGYAYVEHFTKYGTLGIYLDPAYRSKRLSYALLRSLLWVMEGNNLLQPLEVGRPALRLVQAVFGSDYPIKDVRD